MKLRFTRLALADLKEVLSEIARESPSGARRVQRRIRVVIDLLARYPGLGVRTEDPSIRRMVVSPFPYLVFYEIGEKEVIVHAVRHGARDPERMPGE